MRMTKVISAVFMLLFVLACASVDVKQTPLVSDTAAPDFTLSDQDGKKITLSDVLKDYRGVVLAFYPKDDTKL